MIVDSQFRLVRLLRHYSVDEFDDLLIQIIKQMKECKEQRMLEKEEAEL